MGKKEIEEQIIKLQKENKELTERVKMLEKKVQWYENNQPVEYRRFVI